MKRMLTVLTIVVFGLMFAFTAHAGSKVTVCHVPTAQHDSDIRVGDDTIIEDEAACEAFGGHVIDISENGWINGHCKHSQYYDVEYGCGGEELVCEVGTEATDDCPPGYTCTDGNCVPTPK